MAYRSFAESAKHLTAHHPPKDPTTHVVLDSVREAYHDLIDRLEPFVPAGPEATIAARSIHRACQDTIAAIVLNQEA